jgi:uncharacterized protein involved in exopolysaccharide biosynthesis
MPPQQQPSSASALINQLGNVAGLASQSLGIKNLTDPYIGILNSRVIADKIIEQFRLKDIYKKKYLVDARKKLADRTNIIAIKSSLIQISVEDRNPQRAADLANAYVDLLQEQNKRLAVSEASQRRLFYENEVETEKEKLAQAESAFKKMQEQKGIFQVNSQVEAVIRSLAQMRAEFAAREVNLQRLKAGATKNNPEVLRQEIELKALRDQLSKLEASPSKRSFGDPLMPTTLVPEAGLEYTRRLREVKYRETLFELLAKQYEIARIDEAKEAPIIQQVDRAMAPDRKSAPFRTLYIAIGAFLGAFMGCGAAFFAHASENPEYKEKMNALRNLLWIRRNS